MKMKVLSTGSLQRKYTRTLDIHLTVAISILNLNIFRYESTENMTIQCSTKVCSFGKQVVEKVETEYARFEGGRFVYKLHRSPMCEYMINFILKLKHLPETYMKNSVLENFTILQVGWHTQKSWPGFRIVISHFHCKCSPSPFSS